MIIPKDIYIEFIVNTQRLCWDMSETPKVGGRKPKRKEIEVSPELYDIDIHVQKKVDIKDSPPPIMADLDQNTENAAANGAEVIPPWAQKFQKNFFDQLTITTTEVTSLKTLTTELKESVESVHGRVTKVEEKNERLATRAKKSDVKITSLESKFDLMTAKMSTLEDKLLKYEIRDKHCNLLFHGIKEKLTLPKEDCVKAVQEVVSKELGILTELGITKSYRLGREPNAGKPPGRPRPILTTFGSAQVRNEIWKKKVSLKETDYFVTPDLPKVIEDRRAFATDINPQP